MQCHRLTKQYGQPPIAPRSNIFDDFQIQSAATRALARYAYTVIESHEVEAPAGIQIRP
jgi:hypothetical protein